MGKEEIIFLFIAHETVRAVAVWLPRHIYDLSRRCAILILYVLRSAGIRVQSFRIEPSAAGDLSPVSMIGAQDKANFMFRDRGFTSLY